MNKIKSSIPNTLTCCNLVSGCVAVVMALNGNYFSAFLFIIIGTVFDFCDGFSARLCNVSSPIGKELDSLADCVTFGVAPSAMVFSMLSALVECQSSCSCHFVQIIFPYFAFIIAAFSALRLAKFNLDTRQTTSFIGLPTPANALFWASLIVGFNDWLVENPQISLILILALILFSSYLMVAELPMLSFKFKHYGWKGNEMRYLVIISIVLLLILFRTKGFAFAAFPYIIFSALNK